MANWFDTEMEEERMKEFEQKEHKQNIINVVFTTLVCIAIFSFIFVFADMKFYSISEAESLIPANVPNIVPAQVNEVALINTGVVQYTGNNLINISFSEPQKVYGYTISIFYNSSLIDSVPFGYFGTGYNKQLAFVSGKYNIVITGSNSSYKFAHFIIQSGSNETVSNNTNTTVDLKNTTEVTLYFKDV